MFDDTDTDVSDSDCEPNSTTASTSQVSGSGRRIRANVRYLDFIQYDKYNDSENNVAYVDLMLLSIN